ncbi:response regulator [Thiomicrorhabdus lithotrophica]|uniref:Response regulator n=1 Tax=Thiomicrorhabdus lithotrophica TaxID=2949997 RepID=A0ABY8C7W5_9GAMM|nr:response regulator [Thiomicrorhabdus lithotrophica]WEJ62060.1 response regulator [Thiomicrorhabdus lithotrophica]
MLKILILDDAKVIRSLLKLTLESDGIICDEAATVEKALQYAQQNEYDLMIIDYMLEDGHNGLELVEAIKSKGKNIETPCIMLSAEDGANCKSTAKDLGVRAWLKKPFTPNGLLKIVYKVLNIDYSSRKLEKNSMHHHE